jgi:ribosomal protein S2
MKQYMDSLPQQSLYYILQTGINRKIYSKKKNNKIEKINRLFLSKCKNIENINVTFYILRKLFSIVSTILANGGTLLIYSNNDTKSNNYLEKTRSDTCKILYKWFSGILTNRKFITMRAKRIINEFITLKKKIDYIYYL